MQEKIKTEEIIQAVKDADMVLVGIGLECMENFASMDQIPFYQDLKDSCPEENRQQLEQYLKYHYIRRQGNPQIARAYKNLGEMLEGKNYFIVSLCTDDYIYQAGLKQEQIVTPCGGFRSLIGKKDGNVQLLGEESYREDILNRLENGTEKLSDMDFMRSQDGSFLWFNQMGSPEYQEEEYLGQWQKYTLWLQGTLNKKLCILELGAGMEFPSVIRWPFEKVAYFNQKASFFRVHDRLYQLTEELKERGKAVQQHPLAFLLQCGGEE